MYLVESLTILILGLFDIFSGHLTVSKNAHLRLMVDLRLQYMVAIHERWQRRLV